MKSSDKKFKLLSFETLGIVFVLISIIGLLCLFAGKYLFGEVGEVVKGFVLGVFGYLSYVVLILTSIYGVIAIAGVKIKIKIPTKFAILGAIGIYALICVLHLSLTNYTGSYGTYLKDCYFLGFSNPSLGGFFIAITLGLVCMLLKTVGAYIFYIAILSTVITIFAISMVKWINSKTDNTQKRVKNNSQELDIPFNFGNEPYYQDELNLPFGVISSTTPSSYPITKTHDVSSTEDAVNKLDALRKGLSYQDVVGDTISSYPSGAETTSYTDGVSDTIPNKTDYGYDTSYQDAYLDESTPSSDMFIPKDTGGDTPYTIRDTRVSIEEKIQEPSNAISAFDEILKEEKISSFEEERKKAKEEQAKIIEESRLGGLGDTAGVSSDTYEETTTSFSYSDPDPIVNNESEAELQALSFDAIKDYEFIPPPLSLFKSYDAYEDKEKLQEFIDYSIEHIKDVIKERKNHEIDITKIEHGPTFTRFEFKMPVTLPIKDIEGLSADLALHLASNAGVRIAQVPNTDRVGIEVANRERVQVGLKDVLSDKVFLDADPIKCPFVIGKDVTGKSLFLELADLTHILLAGTSGSGKSVFVTSLLLSLMCKVSPKDLRIVICDPKGVDFVSFSGAPHLLIDDIVVEPQKIDKVLAWAVQEMERRYDILKASRVAKIADYNKVMKGKDHMTRILIFVDEFADLVGDKSNSIMEKVQKLAQKARAAGIHLLLATQRPTVDIVSGSIKSNLSTRIALKVQNIIDSRTILDMGGAENLLVHGDMMFYSATNSQIQRAQGPNISGEELYDVLSFIREKNPAIFDERLKAKIDSVPANSSSGGGVSYGGDDDRDLDLKVKALKFVIDTKKTSISAMQREFRIGFNKAALVHDWLIKEGYITDLENGKAQINITLDQYKAKFGGV